jgi:predicted RNA binding protein YcfA (HicA-like mRNA interferase family)
VKRLPRDLSGDQLIQALTSLGYQKTRQKGSHARLTTQSNGEHHVTVPCHDALRVGTLRGILDAIADHFDCTRDDLLEQLFPE